MSLSKILHADSAGPSVQKLYHQSHYVLAGLVPATLVSDKSSIFAKVSDVGLAAAIPLHSHIAMNYVVSDYVPRGVQFPVRAGVAGLSAVMFVGLLKTALIGPGIGVTVKANKGNLVSMDELLSTMLIIHPHGAGAIKELWTSKKKAS
eukprot:jgi/Picsp_1/734/NSC_04223-R1_succinate dehydrogenase